MRSSACVSVAPRIEPFSFGDPVYDGQSTQVTCFVSEGDLPLDLFWTFSGRAGPITSSPLRGGVSVNKMGSKVSMLYIDAASSSRHAGNYTCVATNRAGRADRTATLNVHGKTAQRSLPTTLTLLFYSIYHPDLRKNVCPRIRTPFYLNVRDACCAFVDVVFDVSIFFQRFGKLTLL